MKRVIATYPVAHACLLVVGVIATCLVGCSSRPGDSKAYCTRGNAYAKKGEHDRAIADYSAAIRLQSDNADAYNNRGKVYYLKGEYDRAIADLAEAIRIKPDYAKAYNNRGNAYTKKDEHNRAIADYSEAIRLEPGYADAYCNRGIAYAAKGEHDRAIADYTAAIRINPDYAQAYCDRGIAYAAKGEHDQAIADYTKAIRLQRDYADAHYTRGTAYQTRVSSSSQPSTQWFEGGNLHNATITRWKTATDQNKLATVADWLAATKWEGHLKSLNDFDKLKLNAQRVVNGVDEVVTEAQSDSLQVKEIAAAIIVMSDDIGP